MSRCTTPREWRCCRTRDEPRAERLAVDVRHRIVRERGIAVARRNLACINDGDNVGLLQLRGEFDLALEPLGAQADGQLMGENLDNHGAAEARLFGHKNARHSATTELAVDAVASGERAEQTILNRCQTEISRAAVATPSVGWARRVGVPRALAWKLRSHDGCGNWTIPTRGGNGRLRRIADGWSPSPGWWQRAKPLS